MHIIAPPLDQRIFELAGRHHGAVARWQLRDAGIGPNATWRRVKRGLLVPHVGQSFLVAPAAVSPSHDAHVSACVLAGGRESFLGGEELARRLGTWNRHSGRVDVYAVGHRPPSGRDDVVFHRLATAPGADHRGDVDGIDAFDVTRMLLQLGACGLTTCQVTYVMSEAAALGLFHEAGVRGALEASRGRRGIAVVRAAWSSYVAGGSGTHNRTEDRFLEGVLRIGPVPHVNVRGITGVAGVTPDCAWTEYHRLVEIDGDWSHRRPGAAEADRSRDAANAEAGWRTLRIHWRRVWTDLDGVVEDVARFLGV